MRIVVCPAAHLGEVAAELCADLVLSLHAPGRPPPSLPAGVRHLSLAFNDIAEPQPGLVAPDASTVATFLAAGAAAAGPVLVSCELGISRGPAAAFALACQAAPRTPEIAIADRLRHAAPCATPNALVVALADAILGRGGRMVAAVVAIGRGAEYRPYQSFVLETGLGPMP